MSRSLSRSRLQQLAGGDEALGVVLHAMRQAQRGKYPAMPYGYIRNPRIALEVALYDLGFSNLNDASQEIAKAPSLRPWSSQVQVRPGRNRLSGPLPFNMALCPIALEVVTPRRPRRFYSKMDLGFGQPVNMTVVVQDVTGKRINLQLRLDHDLTPGEPWRIIMRGQVRVQREVYVCVFGGVQYRITNGQTVQIQISPYEGVFLLEFI